MNDYIECMIAAGWIDAGDVDDEFQAYKRNAPFDLDVQGYAGWLELKQRAAEVTAQYDAEIEPLLSALEPGRSLPYEQQQRQRELLAEMSFLDWQLGY